MNKPRLTLALVACLASLGGCNIDYKVIENEPGPDGSVVQGDGDGAGDGDSSSSGDGGGDGSASPPIDPEICTRGGACSRVSVKASDKLDLLFVVDNSGSMREEQASLRAEIRKMVRALTSGDLDGDGELDIPRARNLHVGVLSSDRGLIGHQRHSAVRGPRWQRHAYGCTRLQPEQLPPRGPR